MALQYWLVKSEPNKYPWAQLVEDRRTLWDGVRNHAARNNLAAMKKGDAVLYYHSNEGKEVVGVAAVVKESYPDPTSDDERWLVVDLAPRKKLAEPVSLAAMKAEPALVKMELLRQGRLSVVPVRKAEFRKILAMGKTKL